jgi:hypothetical protein
MNPAGWSTKVGLGQVFLRLLARLHLLGQPPRHASPAGPGLTGLGIAVFDDSLASTLLGMVHVVTGLIWLLLGLTGTANLVARLVKRPIVVGIILGLGFGLMIEGAKMMSHNWWISGAALLGTSLLLTNRTVPAMFLLLLFGAVCGLVSDPTLIDALRGIQIEPRLPTFALGTLTWNDLLIGTVFLALPQVP